MSKIVKLILTNPDANLMIIKNGEIQGNTISIHPNVKNDIFLPSMYQSWTVPQKTHIRFHQVPMNQFEIFRRRDAAGIPNENDILYIFDTWGTSSYYHLLIDHIIPVWITKQVVNQYLLEQNETVERSHYLRISTNGYKTELPHANSMFKHFLGEHFVEQMSGKFKYIVYGYCNNYRPYHGGLVKYYPNYQKFIDQFLHEFVKPVTNTLQEKCILLLKRENRNFIDMYFVYSRLTSLYNVKLVDFSEYTITEQIELCKNAYAMIGPEGAAFSNQIFMPPKSFIISFTNVSSRNDFHSSLAQYMKHRFHTVVMNNLCSQTEMINKVIHIIDTEK